MPNPHFRVGVYSRSGGRSVIAASAYRAGEALTAAPSVVGLAAYRSGQYLGDSANGETFDYTRKEGVEWTHIYTPDNAPAWASDRQRLWNHVELAECRKDAQLARGMEASLPRELGPDEWRGMVDELAGRFTTRGLIVDAAIHNVKARDGGDNPHIHLLITMRPLEPEGGVGERDSFGSKMTVRDLNRREALTEWREAWETITNNALERAGREERLSLKSYQERGIEWEPQIALGPEAHRLECQGKETTRGTINRRRTAANQERWAQRQETQRPQEARDPGTVWYDSFSYGFDGSLDAARDAVHRFRQRDTETAERNSEPLSDRNLEEQMRQRQQAATNARDDRTAEMFQRQQSAPTTPSSRVAEGDARQSVQAAGTQARTAGVSPGVEQSRRDTVAPSPVPDVRPPQETQRALGRQKEGTSPPPPSSPEAARRENQMSARAQQGQQSGLQANAVRQQQNSPDHARTVGYTQHQYATPTDSHMKAALEQAKAAEAAKQAEQGKDKGRDGR